MLNNPKDWFPGATILAENGVKEITKVEALHSLLSSYLVVKSGHTVGLNVEITSALLGENSRKLALLDENHPRINDDGELVDEWETPYFFHANSRSDMDIRSAGPDQVLYTEDDLVATSQ